MSDRTTTWPHVVYVLYVRARSVYESVACTVYVYATHTRGAVVYQVLCITSFFGVSFYVFRIA